MVGNLSRRLNPMPGRSHESKHLAHSAHLLRSTCRLPVLGLPLAAQAGDGTLWEENMKPAKPGDLRISGPQCCLRLAVGAFAAGVVTGAALYAQLAVPVVAAPPAAIPVALVEVGQYLCKGFDGLKDLARVGPEHYAYKCRELAEFPAVQVTQAEGRKP